MTGRAGAGLRRACTYHPGTIAHRTGLMARRLAAILAADVVGYSRLMAADEAGTHARLKALRQDFIEPQDRRAPRPHRQADGRRRARRVRERGRGGRSARSRCRRAWLSARRELPEDRAHRASGSASTSATSSSRTTTFTATASTSPPGSRRSPSPAKSASRAPSATTSGQASVRLRAISASSGSRTSRARCTCYRVMPMARVRSAGARPAGASARGDGCWAARCSGGRAPGRRRRRRAVAALGRGRAASSAAGRDAGDGLRRTRRRTAGAPGQVPHRGAAVRQHERRSPRTSISPTA